MKEKKTILVSVAVVSIALTLVYLFSISLSSDYILSVIPGWHTSTDQSHVVIAILVISILLVLTSISIFKLIEFIIDKHR